MLRCGIRWFAPKLEPPPCVYAVFRSARGGTGGPTAVRFEATSHKFLVERKVEEDRIEIKVDSETLEALSTEEDVKLRAVLAKALGGECASETHWAPSGASSKHGRAY